MIVLKICKWVQLKDLQAYRWHSVAWRAFFGVHDSSISLADDGSDVEGERVETELVNVKRDQEGNFDIRGLHKLKVFGRFLLHVAFLSS